MNEHVNRILNHPQRIPVAAGLVGLGVGFGLGYILGRRNKYEATIEVVEPDLHDDPNQMKIEFDSEELAEDLSDIRDYLEERKALRRAAESPAPKTVIYETDEDGKMVRIGEEEPQTARVVIDEEAYAKAAELQDELVRPAVEEFVANKLKEKMIEHQGSDPDEVVSANVFANDDDDEWDYNREVKNRSPQQPYVLHKDEFWANELDYTQITLTYYAGDETMVDEDDTPIYSFEQVTGPLLFGHGSGDPRVFHVRNDKRKAEYEILYHEGLYSVEVLGLEMEDDQRARDLKHSDNRKFRPQE